MADSDMADSDMAGADMAGADMADTRTRTDGGAPPPDLSGKQMGALKRVYRGTNDIDFPRVFRVVGVISVVLVLASVAALLTRGLELSIDFEGGSVWEIPSQDFTTDQAEAVLADAGIKGGQIQEAETVDGDRILRVTGEAQSVQEGADTAVKLADAASIEPGDVTVNTVGPSWGDDITRQARTSLIVFMALVALYITWRMEARMAFAALVAVLHDIVITLGIYSLFQITITPATVISFLTILGFSLYDTIVVYDRVQENAERLLRTGRYTYTAIMRRSLNQVMMRSINTSITTILPIVSMLIVGKVLFGQQTLADFSLALLIGLLLGAYSSLFVASPLTMVLKERESTWREVRKKLANKGMDPADTTWHGVGGESPARPGSARAAGSNTSGTKGTARAARAGDAGGNGAPMSEVSNYQGHPPRPRKKRKR